MLPYINTVSMRASPPAPTKEQQYLRECVDSHLAMVGKESPFRTESVTIPRAWLTEADHKRRMRLLNREFNNYKKECQGEELAGAYQAFVDGREQEMHALQEDRWCLVITVFSNMADRPEYSHVKLAGAQKAFYEVMFRCQPAKFITRARFLTAMRLVYGFDSAKGKDSLHDKSLTDVLNTLYTSFDTFHQDKVDWRSFLFMVRVVHDYYESPFHHFAWGFSLYGSEGSMDFEGGGGVRLQDLLDLICCLTLRHKRKEMEALFLTAWMEMVRNDMTAQKLTEKTLLAGQHQLETRITLTLFKGMLGLSPLRELFGVVSRHGLPDRSPWTYLMEEKYMHPTATKHIWERRRERRNLEQCKLFVKQTNLRNKGRTMQMWWKYVWRRCRARYLLQAMVIRYCARNIHAALLTWRFWTMAPASAVTLQRLLRGFLGRLECKVRRRLNQAAILVQCGYRRHICQRKLEGYLSKRKWAAIEIQRHVRGSLARRFIRIKVVTYMDDQLYKIARERAALMAYPLEYAALRIQTLWRCHWQIRQYKEIMAAHQRRLLVEEQMRQVELENQRQRLIYQKQIEAYYQRIRKEAKQKIIDDQRVLEVKWDMRKRQRQRRYEEKLARLVDEETFEAANFEDRVQGFMDKWEQAKTDRMEAVKVHILKVMSDPDNDHEREERKELDKVIQQRLPGVTQELDKKGLRLETWQLLEVCRDELVDERVEEERKKVHAEMIEAAKAFQRQREEAEQKLAETKGRTEAERKQRAAAIIQLKLYRPWKARKRIREVCCRRYKKLFDPQSHKVYYFNPRTGSAQWHKPAVMGAYDIEMKDEWYGMVNDPEGVDGGMKDVKYYYNPKTMLIEWKQPPGTIVCDVCKFEFAKKRTTSDRKYFCESCWHGSFQEKPERYTTAWKPCEGGNIKAKETSIELYPDRFDDDPKVLEAYNNQLLLEAQAAEQEQLALTAYQQHQAAHAYDLAAWGMGSTSTNGAYYQQTTSNSSTESSLWTCQQCCKMKASRYCHQCRLYYCSVCSLVKHSKRDPLMAGHLVEDVTQWPALQPEGSSSSQTGTWAPPGSSDETAASDVSSVTWKERGNESIESVEE